jgi:CBS domain-containing protein
MSQLPIVFGFMDKSFATVQPDTPMQKAIRLLIKRKLTGVLAVDAGELVGQINRRDIVKGMEKYFKEID